MNERIDENQVDAVDEAAANDDHIRRALHPVVRL